MLDTFRYYPHFILGLALNQQLRQHMPRLAQGRVFLALCAICALAFSACYALHVLYAPLTVFLLSLVLLPAVLVACMLAERHPWSRPLSFAGRKTLVIYLVHPYPLLLLSNLPRPAILVDWAWIPLVLVVIVVASLAIGSALKSIPGLFSLPNVPPWLITWFREQAPQRR
jgi:peptidoglycan/LPS O-acetylase OafA/YrhL